MKLSERIRNTVAHMRRGLGSMRSTAEAWADEVAKLEAELHNAEARNEKLRAELKHVNEVVDIYQEMYESEQVGRLEKKAKAFEDAANRAFVVLEETPEPVWDDEGDINNRIQEAHDILDTVLTKYFREE